MTIFHEMYGLYYRITEKLLRRSDMTEKDVSKAIQEGGFRDSMLFLPQKLLPQADGSDWGLLRRNADGTLSPVTKHLPEMPLTLLQKRWLKAKLHDEKLRIFIADEQLAEIGAALSDVAPLYMPDDFRIADHFADGDAFADEAYRAHFRKALYAVRHGELAEITFLSGHGRRVRQAYLPLAVEYSQKNDKFRLLCRCVRAGRLTGSATVNIGRIEEIRCLGICPETKNSAARFFSLRRCKEPVTVRVTDARNGVERFMMEFASYEKKSARDRETGECTVQLWYDTQDETELLIQLLSFGPVIEILGPPEFRAQASARVDAQYRLLFGSGSDEV